MTKIIPVLLLALLVASCAPSFPSRAPDPIIDPLTIKDQAKYRDDLAACRGLSDQAGGVVEGGAQGAVIGATGGAVVGGLTGAVLGAPGTGAALGGIAGGASGGTTGGALTYVRQRQVLMLCMIGRGYHPLG